MAVGPPGPNNGFTPPDLDEEPQLTAPPGPDIDAQMFLNTAKKLFGADAMQPRAATKGWKAATTEDVPPAKTSPARKSGRRRLLRNAGRIRR